MKHTWKKAAAGLMAMALVVGAAPANVGTGGLFGGTSITAYADETETLLTTITPTGETTHSATVDGVVTVSHNNDDYYGTYGWLWYDAVDTLTVSACEGYTITKCIFKQNAKNPVTDSSAPFELHFDSAGQYGGILCRENSAFDGVTSIEVYGYVTPAAPTFTNASVTLNDGFGLNFYIDNIDSAEGYTVKFSGKCDENGKTVTLNSTEDGKFYATANVDAKNLRQTITAELYKGDEKIDTLEYSVGEYLTDLDETDPGDKVSLVLEATAMFGDEANNYFTVGDDFLESSLDTFIHDKLGMTDEEMMTDINSHAAESTALGEKKISLVLNSKIKLRVYEADMSSYSEVSELTPITMADTQTVGGCEVSAYAWIYRVLNNTESTNRNRVMAKALYAYMKAAEGLNVVDVESVSITNAPTEDMTVGDTATLSATVSPENATDKTVTWSSDDSTVVSIDETTGEITAVGAGTATITATAAVETDTCTITVKPATIAVTGITIDNAPTEALFVNSTGTLTATVSPDNATDKTIVWSSSDPDYVSINAETGEYTVMGKKGYGSATITATATNGTEDTSDDVSATCTITGKVTYTSLSVGTVLHVGDTFYAGKVYFNTSPAVSFLDSSGVITLVEDNGCYKFKRGSNGTMPNVTAYKIKDNTDGVYIVSGSGTSTSDKFTLAVHTTN